MLGGRFTASQFNYMLECPFFVDGLDVVTGFTFGHIGRAWSAITLPKKTGSKRLLATDFYCPGGPFAATPGFSLHKLPLGQEVSDGTDVSDLPFTPTG